MRPAVAIILACLPMAAVAQEAPPPGASSCTGCHDDSIDTELSLEGMSAEEIVTAVSEIRSGERSSVLMDRIAKGFTDDEITAIAAWLTREDAQ